MVEASSGDLKAVFNKYTANAAEMDGKTFAKVAKDTKILDKKLTATDIDLIFAKSKQKAARKITYAEFQKAVGFCAEKKGVTAADLGATIAA